jgi:hypothetical protein
LGRLHLDLFVIDAPNCNTTCSAAATCVGSPAAQPEYCTVAAQAHATYFIVVDGDGVSNFTLSLTAI